MRRCFYQKMASSKRNGREIIEPMMEHEVRQQLQSSNTAHSEARRTAVRMIALEICIGMCFFCMERRPVPSLRS